MIYLYADSFNLREKNVQILIRYTAKTLEIKNINTTKML